MSTTEVVLQAISSYWRDNKFSPTMREVMEMAGLRTTSAVSHHIDKLRKQGRLVDSSFGMSRNLTPQWVAQAIDEKIKARRGGA